MQRFERRYLRAAASSLTVLIRTLRKCSPLNGTCVCLTILFLWVSFHPATNVLSSGTSSCKCGEAFAKICSSAGTSRSSSNREGHTIRPIRAWGVSPGTSSSHYWPKRQLLWQHLCPICPKTWRLNYWQVLLWSYEVAFHFLPSLGAPVQILLGLTVGTGGTIGSCQRNCRMNGWQMRIGKLLFAGDRMERWQSGVWYVWQLHCALVFIRRSFAPRGRSMWPFCGVAKRHSSNNDHRLQKEQYILWICLQLAHRNSSRFQESQEKHILHCTLCAFKHFQTYSDMIQCDFMWLPLYGRFVCERWRLWSRMATFLALHSATLHLLQTFGTWNCFFWVGVASVKCTVPGLTV